MLALFVSLASADPTSRGPLPATEKERIRHIENHLLPPVLLNDEPVRTTMLFAMMRQSGVPGVSIAYLQHDLVLRPARMLRSSFEQPIAALLREDAATPYDAQGKPVPGGAHRYPEQAAAGLWTTPSDLARFAINIQHSLAGGSDGILRPAIAREMLRPVGKGAWSLGYRVGGGPGHPYFLHGGWNAGFRSLMAAFDSGDGIVIMTNGDAGNEITSAILRTVAAEYDWPQFQPKRHRVKPLNRRDLDRFVGRFRAGAEGSINVTRQGDRLYVQVDNNEVREITPEGPARFFSRTNDMLVTFELDPHRRPTEIKIDTLLAAYRGTLDH